MIPVIVMLLEEIEETRKLMARYEKMHDYERLFQASQKLEHLVHRLNHEDES